MTSRPSPIKEFAVGAGYFLRGMGLILRRGRLFALGLIPPVISSVLLIAAVITFASQVDRLARALTSWWAPAALAELIAFAVAAVLVIFSLALAVIIFSALTLAIGAPIYEKISEAVERACDGERRRASDEPWWRGVSRGVGQSLLLLVISLTLAIPTLLIGLIPVIGSITAAVTSALIGATMITMELIGGPFDRRGKYRLREKYQAIKRSRARALGFGVPVFLLFSIPLVAVFAFPAATAGGTLLSRYLLGESDRIAAPGRTGGQSPATG